jgi:hypothetical protein
MKRIQFVLVVVALLAFAADGMAQRGRGRGGRGGPPPAMSFFITSVGGGSGADLGGLEGADRHCQELAEAAGSTGKTWHAYLSTTGAGGVNARDRIGDGPWHNVNGEMIAANVADLHGDVQRDRNNLTKLSALNEKGEGVSGRGDDVNRHDILTGSMSDGRASYQTCDNWTNSGEGTAMIGHHDRTGGGNTSWNSAHATRGCDQESLAGSGGAGLFYCFAIN